MDGRRSTNCNKLRRQRPQEELREGSPQTSFNLATCRQSCTTTHWTFARRQLQPCRSSPNINARCMSTLQFDTTFAHTDLLSKACNYSSLARKRVVSRWHLPELHQTTLGDQRSSVVNRNEHSKLFATLSLLLSMRLFITSPNLLPWSRLSPPSSCSSLHLVPRTLEKPLAQFAMSPICKVSSLFDLSTRTVARKIRATYHSC